MSARKAFATVLRTYAEGISENLRCVLTECDAEGPHQLRVTLRRLRVALRVFKPAIRGEAAKRIGWVSRYLGAIVGELRDTDVIIDEILRPAVGANASLTLALGSWREDLRGKVRVSLRAARATSFANDLLIMAERGDWRAKAKRGYAARVLISDALNAFEAKASAHATNMLSLAPFERHDLRKDLKSLRYGAEFAAAYDPSSATLAASLKRLQTVLGRLNDMEMLETFDPQLGAEQHAALAKVRQHLSEEHAKLEPGLIATAHARWLDLVKSARGVAAMSC